MVEMVIESDSEHCQGFFPSTAQMFDVEGSALKEKVKV